MRNTTVTGIILGCGLSIVATFFLLLGIITYQPQKEFHEGDFVRIKLDGKKAMIVALDNSGAVVRMPINTEFLYTKKHFNYYEFEKWKDE